MLGHQRHARERRRRSKRISGLDEPLARAARHVLRRRRSRWTSANRSSSRRGAGGHRRPDPAEPLSDPGSVFVALVIAVPLGIISAARRNRLGRPRDPAAEHGHVRDADVLARADARAAALSLKLDLLPVSGYGEGLVGVLRSLTLPALDAQPVPRADADQNAACQPDRRTPRRLRGRGAGTRLLAGSRRRQARACATRSSHSSPCCRSTSASCSASRSSSRTSSRSPGSAPCSSSRCSPATTRSSRRSCSSSG